MNFQGALCLSTISPPNSTTAPTSPSPPTRARSCSSSTPPASAASPRNTRACRSSTPNITTRGLEVLGFPCDQFGHQEPGSDDEITSFCEINYGVNFPLFSKIEVNGDNAHPLYKFLKNEKGGLLGDAIKWNFTKFLVDKQGSVVERFAPTTTPEKIASDIERELAK